MKALPYMTASMFSIIGFMCIYKPDLKNRVLESWKFKVMQDVAIGLKPLTEKLKWGFRINLRALLMRGFDEL